MAEWYEKLEVLAKAKGLNVLDVMSLVREADADIYREFRTLKYRLKIANKAQGKQGHTIYQLRNEVAALREAVTFNPGDRARMLRENREQAVRIRELEAALEKADANNTPLTWAPERAVSVVVEDSKIAGLA